MNDRPAVWIVRSQAEPLGRHLAAGLGGPLLGGPWAVAAATGSPGDDPAAPGEGGPGGPSLRARFAASWTAHPQWVLVMASGIAARFLQGLLRDKRTDPAVVVLDEAARFAVPLVGGHEGGANRLAFRVAALTGAVPVITTATETLKPLVVGIGCRRGVSADRIDAAVRQALAQAARFLDEVREVATVDRKADEPGLREWSERHGLPLRVLPRAWLRARPWVTQPSAWVQAQLGVAGVCEPCALLASTRGRLVVPKLTREGVAVAVAEEIGWPELGAELVPDRPPGGGIPSTFPAPLRP